LRKFVHLEAIPRDWNDWHVNATGASALAATLAREWEQALLFRKLATLRTDIPLFKDVEQLRWNGHRPEFEEIKAALAGAKVQRAKPQR